MKVIELSWLQGIGYRVSEPNYCGEGERKELVELESALDVLHRADSAMRHAMATTAIAKPAQEEFGASFREIDNLLREHGRVV
jgi:hypothetical protein